MTNAELMQFMQAWQVVYPQFSYSDALFDILLDDFAPFALDDVMAAFRETRRTQDYMPDMPTFRRFVAQRVRQQAKALRRDIETKFNTTPFLKEYIMREFDAWLAARPQMEQTSVLSRIRAVSPALLTVFGDWRRGLPFCVEAAIILKEQAQIGAWQFQPQAFAAFQARRQQENTRRAAHGVPALAASALTAAAR